MLWARFFRGLLTGESHNFFALECRFQELRRTFSQEEVVDTQWDLLISNFKDSKTIALVKENMRRISNGSSPHCAATLKLGLQKAFDLKTGVRLRCSYSRCIWYTDRVSYSSVGKDTAFCQMCRNRDWGDRYFQCVGCGSNRTGAHALCKSCGKRFL